MTLLKACFFIVIFYQGLDLKAQRFDSLLNKLDTEYPQEKLYLQFDRAMYNPGETIWFKAYLFSANLPTLISKTLYAELIDDKGKVLQRKTTPLIMSSAAAAFDLPANISATTLYVRAYTKWMLNFDSSFLYVKSIPLITKSPVKSEVLSIPSPILQFFPEGGDLVQGLESRVAFKATDFRGIPIQVNGEITNEKGEKITPFSSIHDGMGFFMLQPANNEKYKATWKDKAGKTHQTFLPTAKKEGVVLETRNTEKGIQFIIKRSPAALGSSSSLHVVAQMQQQLLYRAKANLSTNQFISGVIPREHIPTGIVQITLFTEDEMPIAERIVFVNHQDYYFITDLNAALKNLNKKGRNVIQIDVPDTIACNLSVSVTDAGINPAQKGEDDIFSHVLLTSDIKGYVHNPAYYFSSEADSVSSHLDLVMMTNGWRRFNWEKLLSGQWPKLKHIPEDYLAIEGQVTGLNKNVLARKEITGILELSKSNQQFLNIPLSPDGSFNIPGMLFFDTARLYYQFNNDKNKVLTSSASFKFNNNLLNEPLQLKIDTSLMVRLANTDTMVIVRNRQLSERNLALQEEQRRNVQTLESVTVTAKVKSKKEIMDDEYTSGLFKGDNGYTFITEDDPFANSSLSVLNYLQGKVPGLQISMAGGQSTLSWRGGTPTLFMNEMQGDVDMVQSLSMSDVAMIKVFRPPFFGAFGGGSGGAIAVYTKKGNAVDENLKGLDFARIPGYTPIKEFYSPDYSIYDPSHIQDDYRTTLYWNPYVITNKDSRRIILNFYNNDITKRIRVVIEGVDAHGKLTRIEKIFE